MRPRLTLPTRSAPAVERPDLMTPLAAQLAGVSAVVVGDVMLDRQLVGHAHRISPEAPVPVVRLADERASPGGAGHVAASLAALGCTVTLAAAAGDDPEGDLLRRLLRQAGVAELSLAAA